MSKISAAAYYRMSSDKQEASIPAQRTAVESYASTHGYRIICEYQDEAISGDDTEQRAGFLRMREDVDSGKFAVVLCWDQDRFGRFDPLEAGHWIRPFRMAGVRLETVGQGSIDWETFAGRLLFMIQQEGKHQYLRDLSRNVLRGHLAGFSKGRWQGRPPYGYDLQNNSLVPNKDADTVRLMFDLYANQGYSLRGLTAYLNTHGLLNYGGTAWRFTMVRKTLTRKTYLGHYLYGRGAVSKYHHTDKAGQVADGPAKEPVVLERANNHPPLVDPETFAKVGRILESRKGRRNVCKTNYALGGLLRCGHCGKAMVGERQNLKDGVRLSYCCSQYMLAGSRACNRNAIWEDHLLAVVASQISAYWQDADLRKSVAGAAQKRNKPTKSNREGLERRARELEARIAKGRSRLLTVPDKLYQSLLTELEAAEAEHSLALDALAEAEPEPSLIDAEYVTRKAVELISQLEASIHEYDSTAIRNSLSTLINHVELHFTHRLVTQNIRSYLDHGQIHILLPEDVGLVSEVQAKGTHRKLGILKFSAAAMIAAAESLKPHKSRRAA